MTKLSWNPGTMIAPLPPALISSGDMTTPNVMTAAWTGIICSDPVITYVSLRPSRYTHELVSKSKEFVINIPTWKEAEAVDTVGVKSGRDGNKFTLTGLTPEPSTKLKAPQVAECPISLECKVLEIRPFGTHDMFLAEVVAVNVDEKYVDENGALDLEKAGLLAYAHGFYYTLGRKIGKFGFSVEKKKKPAPEMPASTPAPTAVAEAKFSKKKLTATDIRKKEKAVEEEDEVFTENGVEVIVKKQKFIKPAADLPRRPFKSAKPEKDGKKRSASSFKSPRKPEAKFSRKDNKKTSYEPHSYKKKSDGSFKRKPRA